MPSVEMRRSTRVFVPKAKDAELVRVLRSGRRLCVDSSDVKQHRGSNSVGNDDEWFRIIEKPPPYHLPRQRSKELENNGVNGLEDSPKLDFRDVDEEEAPEAVEMAQAKPARNEVRVITNVYTRKRKRSGFVSSNSDGVNRGKRKFGLHYVRRKTEESSVENRSAEIEVFGDGIAVLSVVIESSCGECRFFSRFLFSVLRYLRSGNIELAQVSGFLQSRPISDVFSSVGIRYLWNRPCVKSRGVCRISQGRWFVPLFTVDFSAVPLCFADLHIALSLRLWRHSCLRWMKSSNNAESSIVEDVPHLCTNVLKNEPLINNVAAPDFKDYPKGRKIVVAALEACKVGGACKVASSRNAVPFRSGVFTRSSSKRRRRSLRSRRARSPSHFVMQKVNAPLKSDQVTLKQTITQLPSGFNLELRRSARKNPPAVISMAGKNAPVDISVPESGSVGLTVDTDSPQCCFANVLVVETDRCYRVEGAEVSLESSSNEWVLAVKKDGVTRNSLKVQREMRPSTTNRFTHATVWSADNGWKLEFPNRKDWLVFKELYKVCGEKNVVPTTPVVKIIPVPGVLEVTSSWGSGSSPFKRPESYIRMTSDELSRVLLSQTANYDMDSEDEAWLSKFNSELDEENLLLEETFELMVDAFEKASYLGLEGFNNEDALRLDLASPRVVEPVYRYWMKKRKQRRVPLLRVFELNEPKRTQLISKPVLRKKRSLKRTTVHPNQRGRGKDSSVLQALASEQNAMKEQHALLRVQEAKASADKSVEVAVVKRQRAQFLMENADLAMYRATMALRIADAAGRVVDSQQAAAHFLD